MNVRKLTSPLLRLEERQRKSRKLVAGLCALLVLNTLLGIYLIAVTPEVKQLKTPPRTTVRVSAPAVTLLPAAPSRLQTVHRMPSYTSAYAVPMAGTSAPSSGSWRLTETSKANVHVFGGGGQSASGGIHTSSGSKASSINASVPMTSFVVLRSRQPMADAGAQQAPQMAELAAAPSRRAPGPPNPPGPLPEDHQLVEHPLPDGMWVLLLLAITYAFGRFFSKKATKRTHNLCNPNNFCTFAARFVKLKHA